MMKKEDVIYLENDALLNDYVYGRLSGDSLADLESAIRRSEALAAEVLFRKRLAAVHRHPVATQALVNLNGWLATHPFPTENRWERWLNRLYRYRTWALGLGTVACLNLGSFAYQQKVVLPRLATQYFKHYELHSPPPPNPVSLKQGLEGYATHQYQWAIAPLETYLASQPLDLEIQLYLGVCYLATRQPQQAIPRFNPFQQALPDYQTYLQKPGLWYLALAHLQNGDKKQALALLKQFDTPEAKRLLAELE